MKNLLEATILTALSLLTMTSCSATIYQQIMTLKSENVALNEGDFIDETPDFTIEYDFWSEYGRFIFSITNNTDEDFYVDLGRSFFINNGNAFDYYRGRTFSTTENKPNLVEISADGTPVITSRQETVSYEEKDIVCIPARSTKHFGEYTISEIPYRECGLMRDPSRKELAIMHFDKLKSPVKIENRLTLIIRGETIPVNHNFYVSEIQNIAEENVIQNYTPYNCDNTKSMNVVKVNRLKAQNKFFIRYSIDLRDGGNNDRKKGQ